MPILDAEPSLYPEALLTSENLLESPQARWFVLHTKPRQEKSLARDLLDRGIPFFLPLLAQPRSLRGRDLISYLPLFDSYVFLYTDTDSYYAALSTRRVVRVLPVENQVRFHSDLRQLHHLIASGLPLTPEPLLSPGQLVDIVSGPLTGFRGRVVRSSTGKRFVVEVDFIGRGASVLCDGMTLRPVAVP